MESDLSVRIGVIFLHPNDAERAVSLLSAADWGAMLRDRRKKLGYTQEQVAEMMGCSARLIGDIEHGKRTVGVQRIIDLTLGLGIDLCGVPRGE